ncbi:MAG TPA: 2OG-Fe(II) oxygenase [Haliangium sp.]|nr:2OG-Fe(II) oxygenase [Haliangium sp.]
MHDSHAVPIADGDRTVPSRVERVFAFAMETRDAYAACCHFDSALSRDEVQRILALTEKLPSEAATLNSDRTLQPERRQSTVRWLHLADQTSWIFERVSELVRGANQARYGFDLRGIYEPLQVTEYVPGAFFDWHEDHGPGTHSLRKLSVAIQLSDPADYDGGELELFYGFEPDRAVRALGTALVFPSYVLHRVSPVTRGVRRSLVGWVSGPPFR